MSPASIDTPAASAARCSSSGETARPGFRNRAAIEPGDIEQDAARDHRRRVLDAELVEAPVGHDFGGVEPVIEPVADREMAERVDMRADMHRHLDPFEIGAGVVGRAGLRRRLIESRKEAQIDSRYGVWFGSRYGALALISWLRS